MWSNCRIRQLRLNEPKAAVITSVQTQILMVTHTRRASGLQSFINGLCFVGLVHDILGTSFGVIHAILLQRPMPRPLPVEELQRQLQQKTDATNNSALFPGEVLHHLQAEVAKRQKFWSVRRYSADALEKRALREHVQRLFLDPPDKTFKPVLKLYARGRCVLGLDPIYALAVGALCLFISVLCFAYDTQPRSIFLACVILASFTLFSMVTGGTLCLCAFGISLHILNIVLISPICS